MSILAQKLEGPLFDSLSPSSKRIRRTLEKLQALLAEGGEALKEDLENPENTSEKALTVSEAFVLFAHFATLARIISKTSLDLIAPSTPEQN